MWSLFPKSWFASADPKTKQLESAVHYLRTGWLGWLVAALHRADRSQVVTRDRVVAALELSNGATLLRVDQAFRRRPWEYWDENVGLVQVGRRLQLTPIDLGDPQTAAYLFVAACNPYGMLRERALIAFAHSPGRLALAAALIRCDDWVPQVQDAAVALLVGLLETEAAASLFDFVDLLLRLRERQRISMQVWPEHIEPALARGEFRLLRWALTDAADASQRAFAYELIRAVDPDRTEQALDKASGDQHPRIALWALREAAVSLAPASVRASLRGALRHPHAAVRAQALRELAAIGIGDLRDELRRALCDASRGPRDSAAFLLQSLFQESALAHWRAGIESRDWAVRRVSLDALSLAAMAEDGAHFERFVDDPSARVRAMALRGLARTQAADVDARLRRALRDPSAVVVRFALRLLAAGANALDREELESALRAATSDSVRLPLIHAARLLSKWESLVFLLRFMAVGEEPAARAVGAEIQRWMLAFNRRFTVLPAAQRDEVWACVRAAKASTPGFDWVGLERMVSCA